MQFNLFKFRKVSERLASENYCVVLKSCERSCSSKQLCVVEANKGRLRRRQQRFRVAAVSEGCHESAGLTHPCAASTLCHCGYNRQYIAYQLIDGVARIITLKFVQETHIYGCKLNTLFKLRTYYVGRV